MPTQSKATLQLALTDEIPAYALEGVVYIINELYTGYCWLEQAEKHTGPDPYGDYKFSKEDFLLIKKADIGTPNLLALYGWIEPLKETLKYLGGVTGLLGLLKISSEALVNWKEIFKDKHKVEYEKAMDAEQLRKARLENEKLAIEIERMKQSGQQQESPADKSRRLHLTGKVSDFALGYKEKEQQRIDEKISYGIFENTVIHIELIPD